jgi:hypothetical protein
MKSALDATYGEHSLESRAAIEKCRLSTKEPEPGVDQVIRMLTHRGTRDPVCRVVNPELKHFRM